MTDHLNTVRDLAALNNETGVTSIANHLVYDAFGRVTSQTDPAVGTLFGFTARPFDRDTGLQNNLNRWYDAETGTWISEDPKSFAAADANLYRYVGNEVTVTTDPTGLYWNRGNPFSKPMWDLFYYWDIENEAKERERHRCLRDPNYAATHIRDAQRIGQHQAAGAQFIAESGVQANAMILGGQFVRPTTPAKLQSYGSGQGHHVPAKSAFTGADGYSESAALAIPKAELARLGIKHSAITAAQQTLYREFFKKGGTLTWDIVEVIETKALIAAGMDAGQALATVRAAIQKLKSSGVSGPTRIPWGG
ncbi:MAG: RHS repeat-associated core domain-containing protein [Thermoguttaceae bacterium]|nr:RHS repeat-associated core domain-containing protein [Thermoguttaceae bacterium]